MEPGGAHAPAVSRGDRAPVGSGRNCPTQSLPHAVVITQNNLESLKGLSHADHSLCAPATALHRGPPFLSPGAPRLRGARGPLGRPHALERAWIGRWWIAVFAADQSQE